MDNSLLNSNPQNILVFPQEVPELARSDLDVVEDHTLRQAVLCLCCRLIWTGHSSCPVFSGSRLAEDRPLLWRTSYRWGSSRCCCGVGLLSSSAVPSVNPSDLEMSSGDLIRLGLSVLPRLLGGGAVPPVCP